MTELELKNLLEEADRIFGPADTGEVIFELENGETIKISRF